MSGVAPQYGNGMIRTKKDFEGELLVTSFSDRCKGSTVMKSLEEGRMTPPDGPTREHLWRTIVMCYNMLPDTSRCATPSSESGVSFSCDDLKDSFSKLKQDLIDSLPGLVAPKVSEILKVSQEENESRSVDHMAKKPSPSTPVKRYVNIKDTSDEGVTPMCEEKWTTVVRSKVEKALKNIPVLDTSVNRKHTQLFFETDDDLKEAQKALSPFLDVTPVVEKQKKRDPRLMISDLDQDLLNKDTLMDAILSDKNEGIKRLHQAGQAISVVHVNIPGRYAVIKVAPEIRAMLADNRDRIFLKLRQHIVKDRFYVTQCFHCQRYGHVAGSVYCPNKDKCPTCAFCSGDHDTRQCKAKNDNDLGRMKCVNCDVGGSKEDKRYAKSHPASSNLCPHYVNARGRLMENTSGVTKERKNSYLTRAWEDLKVKRRGGSVH
jgi:hypothetical protein